MASVIYAVLSISNVASMHCAVRPELSPCTCEPVDNHSNSVFLSCERVDSFHQIVDALSNKFTPNISITLKISHSQLEDLEMRSFGEMNLHLTKLKLDSNNMKSVPETPFRGLSEIKYLSLAENDLEEIPKHVLNHLPKVRTLDLGRGKIKYVNHDDFKGVPDTNSLVLVTNQITRMDKGSFPPNLLTLHIGRNEIENLNGTLRDLKELKYLFINMNNISTLEDEFPQGSANLVMILAQNNRIEKLPQSMKDLPNLESLFFQNNRLKSFDGVFKHGRHIVRLMATNNQIEYLAEDEFQEASLIEELELAENHLKSLNKSLLPITNLQIGNFSFNDMEEFSMNEIRGLKYLHSFDISYNKIKKLTGRMENLIEPNTFLVDLYLNNNQLKSLDGALMGLNTLRNLFLAYNQIERILPDDFIGLESLEHLDLSFNQLITLEETSTTYLASLKFLNVAYNNLTKLERDFHGLPVLCQANITHNQIISISSELVAKTRCATHGVPGKLEIWLENNPIMCIETIKQLCPIMESQEARIRGRSQCLEISTEDEICNERPIILQAPLPLLPQIIQAQLQGPAIVQVIVPTSLGGKTVIKAEIPKPAILIPTTTSTTTTTTTTSTTTTTELPLTFELNSTDNSTENSTNLPSELLTTNLSVSTTTIAPIPVTTLQTESSLSLTKFIATSTQSESPPAAPSNQSGFEGTIQYTPIVETRQPSSSSESDDNSVQEQFSPIVLSGPDNTQLLLMPEEPPETP